MTKPTKRKPSSPRAGSSAGSVAKADKKATEPSRTNGAAKKAPRSEELRFKVTEDVRQRFKLAAKAAGLKKGLFLERLLAAWQETQLGQVSAATPPRPRKSTRPRA
jgi:hypothetical protein